MRLVPKGRGPRRSKEPRAPQRKMTIAYAILLLALAYIVWYSATHIDAPSNLDDDTAYMLIGIAAASGHLAPALGNVYSLRLMMALPIAASYLAFGFSQASSAMWDIVSYIGSAVVAFFIGRELCDEYSGAVAALLLAFVPQVAALATTVDDMVPLMFITSLAMLCLILGRRRGSLPQHFLAGALLVAAILVSPLGAIIALLAVLLILADLLYKRGSARGAACFFGGIALGVAALMLFNYLNTGNPATTFIGYISYYSSENIGAVLNLNPALFYLNAASQAFGYSDYGPGSLYFYAVVFSFAYLAWRGERRAAVPALWFGFAFLYLSVGPMHISLDPFAYDIIPGVWRYLDLAAVPMALTIGIAVSDFLVQSLRLFARRRNMLFMLPAATVIAILALMLYGSFTSTISVYSGSVSGLAADRQVASYLSSLPANSTLYVPEFLPYLLTFTQLYSNGRVGFANVVLQSQESGCGAVEGPAHVVVPASWLEAVRGCTGWVQVLNVTGFAAVYYVGAQ